MINQRTVLTKKQRETLDFINDFEGKAGQPPTIKEMREGLKLLSLRSVTQRLEALERKGFIKRDPFKHRGITVLDHLNPFSPEGTMQIPVIASAGADAAQVYAEQQYDEYISVEENMLEGRKEIVAIKAIGNSMVDAGIRNGDYVLVEVGGNVENGNLVVAILGDMAVVKRVKFANDGAVVLYPESKSGAYQPIVMPNGSKIFGKVLRTINIRNDEEEYTYENIPE